MLLARSLTVCFIGSLVVGCKHASDTSPPDGGGGGAPASCAIGETATDAGSCQPAGVPPDACGAGFEPDGASGCRAVLPGAPCEKGQLAVPGETSCHDIDDCGTAPWGSIPIASDTQFVDAANTGGMKDGSQSHPWPSIAEGVVAASPGAIVAIAAGTYAEAVGVRSRLRLWGRCASLVQITGASGSPSTVDISAGADGAEVHDLAVSGAGVGIHVTASKDVLVDHVWIHDTGDFGLNPSIGAMPTAVTMQSSLIEGATRAGATVFGADLSVRSSAVRDSVPDANDAFGRGIQVQADDTTGARGRLLLEGSIVERNHDIAVGLSGSDGTIKASLLRDTAPALQSGTAGIGINAYLQGSQRADVIVDASVLEGNSTSGILLIGSDLTMDASVVRGTNPDTRSLFGRGVDIQNQPGNMRAQVQIRRSLIADNHENGVLVGGSDVTIASTLVSNTLAQVSDGHGGNAMAVVNGVNMATDPPGKLVLTDSVLDGSYQCGLLLLASQATIQRSRIAGVKAWAADGASFGDGVTLLSVGAALATLDIAGSLIENNARAGIASFAGTATVGTTSLMCNAFDLDTELSGTFQDDGGNTCGCMSTTSTCKAVSSSLEPPAFQ